MRKEKLVTRRFEEIKAEILGFNSETSEVEQKSFVIPNKKWDDKKILDYIRKNYESSDFVPVKVLERKTEYDLRAMTESKFKENSYSVESRHNAAEIKKEN